MQKTNIPWTDFSWNPSVGCENDCSYCYARKSHNMRHKAYLAGKKLPIQYAKPFNEIQLFPDRLQDPLHKRKPCKIFVGSVADLFSPSVPFEFIDKVVDVFEKCPQHTGQILTKRAERMYEYGKYRGFKWPDNLIGMVTAENQPMADLRIPYLLQCGFKTTGVSIEPMLGKIRPKCPACKGYKSREIKTATYTGEATCPDCGGTGSAFSRIDWVIVGGESGPKARPIQDNWVRKIKEQCKEQKVSFFFKQWGGVNKKKNGRLLDGQTWDEMPKQAFSVLYA